MGHGFIWVELDVVLVNVTVKYALCTSAIGIKVDDKLGRVGVSHEEAISTGGKKM